MFQFEEEANLVEDREDIIQILNMRFGVVAPQIIHSIYQITSLDTIERLILVAANCDSFETFKEELDEGDGNFKILGERFNPLEYVLEKGDANGDK